MADKRDRRVAVVGATGVAGQQFIAALDRHPWFRVTALAASERSAGRSYREALTDAKTGARRWYCDEEPSPEMLSMPVVDARDLDLDACDIVFTAVESDAARELEPRFAKRRPVFSTASAFRYEEDVPIAVPGVNLDHLDIVAAQQKKRGWKGFVVPLPNCTTMGLVVTLKPLLDAFGLRRVVMTSMQGLSGAGRSPGVAALDVVDNVIPYIVGEEEKVAKETGKILGGVAGDRFDPHPVLVAATCTRANVREGHTEAVQVELEREATLDQVRECFLRFGSEFCARRLPSAPPSLRYMLVSHNTKMGAAKGAVLVAEHMVDAGRI